MHHRAKLTAASPFECTLAHYGPRAEEHAEWRTKSVSGAGNRTVSLIERSAPVRFCTSCHARVLSAYNMHIYASGTAVSDCLPRGDLLAKGEVVHWRQALMWRRLELRPAEGRQHAPISGGAIDDV